MKRIRLASFMFISLQAFLSCSQQASGPHAPAPDVKEGRDYQVFERVRLLDKTGFTEPQEAYSILLPKGWQNENTIDWNPPGSSCAGTFSSLTARSADTRYNLKMYPDITYMWTSNSQLRQLNQYNSPNCSAHQPMNAEQYLKEIFLPEIGNPQITKQEENTGVINQMKKNTEEGMAELRQYGAGQMQIDQTALNAEVKWADGSAGLIVLGASILEMTVPNIYNGSSDKLYTTQITRRCLFRFPSGESEKAKNEFAVIMSSVRTNPAWKDAVQKFWREARQQSHIAHVGKIKMMDEQTRRIGEQAIRNGQQRLNNMDNQMRSWEKQQNSQDYMHTEFIKTIREVENYRDENGKYEISAGYDHVWSRNDGNSFILTNSSTFDPSGVYQDQNWKEMKKVH